MLSIPLRYGLSTLALLVLLLISIYPAHAAGITPTRGVGLVNGSFEEADPLDATLPRYWSRVNAGSGGASVRDNQYVSDGQWALHLTTVAGGAGGLLSQRSTLGSMARVAVEFDARAQGAPADLQAAVAWYNGSNQQISSYARPVTPTGTFARFRVEADVPPGAASVAVAFQPYLQAAGTADVWVDAVVLSPAAAVLHLVP